MWETLTNAYTLDNYPLLASSLLTFLFGYLEYMYSFALVLRERKAPYPIWMHTFYFAHDSTWCIRLYFAARQNNNHWFLLGTSIALLVWNCFEVFNLYMAITVERDEIWGAYVHRKVSVSDALWSTVGQIAGFLCVVNLLIEFMGGDSLFQWFCLTNVLMASGPGELWSKRTTRDGCSVGLALLIVVATVNTFRPWNMFVLAMPELFGRTWYSVTGCVFTCISMANLVTVLRLPAKKAGVKGGGRVIW